MKNLVLIRHAKSSWDDPSLGDRERPLNKRGKKDAPNMGRLLKENGLVPDLILSSPAKRALKTAKLIALELDYPKKKIEIREEIYEQGFDVLISMLSELDEAIERVYLIGHNPELTDLANQLSGAGIDNVPTCGIVSIEFSSPLWKHCLQQGGELILFERPAKSKADHISDSESLAEDAIGT